MVRVWQLSIFTSIVHVSGGDNIFAFWILPGTFWHPWVVRGAFIWSDYSETRRQVSLLRRPRYCKGLEQPALMYLQLSIWWSKIQTRNLQPEHIHIYVIWHNIEGGNEISNELGFAREIFGCFLVWNAFFKNIAFHNIMFVRIYCQLKSMLVLTAGVVWERCSGRSGNLHVPASGFDWRWTNSKVSWPVPSFNSVELIVKFCMFFQRNICVFNCLPRGHLTWDWGYCFWKGCHNLN